MEDLDDISKMLVVGEELGPWLSQSVRECSLRWSKKRSLSFDAWSGAIFDAMNLSRFEI